jgi:hypothetical protein
VLVPMGDVSTQDASTTYAGEVEDVER